MQQNKSKEELQKEFTEKALRNKAKDELHYKLIDRHLSRIARSSIQHYIETGKISGTFWIGLTEYAKDFADQQNQELREQIEQLQAEVKRLRDGLEEIIDYDGMDDEPKKIANQLLKTNRDE